MTGCIQSVPYLGVMSEACILPVATSRSALAARMLAKAAALPPDDPLHALAVADSPTRLKSVTGWRQVGGEAWRALGVSFPVEPLIPDWPRRGHRALRSGSPWTSAQRSRQQQRTG